MLYITIACYDVKTNMDIESGYCHCHSSLDLTLTPDGDFSIITGQEEMNQRFFLYLAIPKGERHDPNIGCYAYDYLHERTTSNTMRRMEQDLRADMAYQFPEFDVQSIACQREISDPYQMSIAIRLATETLLYLYTPDELLTLNSLLSNIVESNY